jgi:hypothetical protein
MIISKQQFADGMYPEENRKLNRFEIESDEQCEQCEQWLLPEIFSSCFIFMKQYFKTEKRKKIRLHHLIHFVCSPKIIWEAHRTLLFLSRTRYNLNIAQSGIKQQ